VSPQIGNPGHPRGDYTALVIQYHYTLPINNQYLWTVYGPCGKRAGKECAGFVPLGNVGAF